MTRSRSFRISLSFALSLLFLWLAIRDVNLGEAWAALRGARYVYVLPAMATVILSFWVRAVRWRIILRPLATVSMGNAYSATMIGFMSNNVLPLRAGEVVRAFVIGRQESLSRSAALATIFVERVFDLVALLTVLFIGAAGHGLPDELRGASWVVAGITAVAFGVMLVFGRDNRIVERLRGSRLSGSGFGLRALSFLDRFQEGLAVFRDLRSTLWVLVLSVVVWGAFVGTHYLALRAFELDFGIRAPIFLLGIVSIGVMLPSAPGYVGTMQLFYKLALVPFAVEDSIALSASVFFWVVQYIPVTLIGLFYFVKMNLGSPRELTSRVTMDPERRTPTKTAERMP
jgi:uncharacterized protein (TIRG00374 family)